MMEIGVAQAQAQFTQLLSQTVFVLDKKTQQKKAVIMPYSEYERLIESASKKADLKDGSFSKFVGVLDNNFKTDDEKYNEIVK